LRTSHSVAPPNADGKMNCEGLDTFYKVYINTEV